MHKPLIINDLQSTILSTFFVDRIHYPIDAYIAPFRYLRRTLYAMQINLKIDGLNQLATLNNALSSLNTKKAIRIATNDSLRWGRTRIRRTIQETYNIKAKRINDNDSRKGLRILLASTGDPLNGRITAGHRPVGLASLTKLRISKVEISRDIVFATNLRTKRTTARKGQRNYSTTGITLEIIKGDQQKIERAFFINGIPFARGQYDKNGFIFRHGKGERQKASGSDTPITGLNTVSIATAALNAKAFHKWNDAIVDYHAEQVVRQYKRLLKDNLSAF